VDFAPHPKKKKTDPVRSRARPAHDPTREALLIFLREVDKMLDICVIGTNLEEIGKFLFFFFDDRGDFRLSRLEIGSQPMIEVSGPTL